MDRRGFLQTAGVSALVASLIHRIVLMPRTASVPTRTLGRSGEKVSMVGLGGYHIGMQNDEQESIRIIRTALDRGINFLDNCWDYNDGQSEVRMGKALRDGYRQKAFLMTKIDGRTKKAATEQLDESLRRLQTDHIDLLQFHEVIRDDDPDRIFAEGGGMEAVLEARKAGQNPLHRLHRPQESGHPSQDARDGLCPRVHLRHRADAAERDGRALRQLREERCLPVLVKHQIGVLGMKPMGDGIILNSKTATPVECLHYAMNLPTSVVITGCDSMKILQQAIDAARSFQADEFRAKFPRCWRRLLRPRARESSSATRRRMISMVRCGIRVAGVRRRPRDFWWYTFQSSHPWRLPGVPS